MDTEIEVIAKKYQLDSEKKHFHKSFDNFSNSHTRPYHDKIKILELENEKLKKKYLECLEKNKNLQKELDQAKNTENSEFVHKKVSEELVIKNDKIQQLQEKLQFYEKQVNFLNQDNCYSSSIFLKEIEYLKLQLEQSKHKIDLSNKTCMKDLIYTQSQNIISLQNTNKSYETIIKSLKDQIQKNLYKSVEEQKLLSDSVSEYKKKYEDEKTKNKALKTQNNFLEARCKNMEYELEITKHSKLKTK